ncbi:hypothetical protein DEO72_LG5g1183 [Vigna unguiculata]|uniref:Uncharacterized protein n=1 Tax=Vigna unguiculata TaxID=3917 RepID=A0A4D6LW12_VIGUN|nr:hypothetical protein DEO72_LG5g1183 [Vigna unguiculata]
MENDNETEATVEVIVGGFRRRSRENRRQEEGGRVVFRKWHRRTPTQQNEPKEILIQRLGERHKRKKRKVKKEARKGEALQISMADLEGAEGYKPSAEYVEDSNDALINLTDSTELLFLKLPSSNLCSSYGWIVLVLIVFLKPCWHHIVRAFVVKTGLRMKF